LACHAAYFAQFLAAQQPLIRTRREREAMQAMRSEADNLRQMWRTATQRAQADWFDRALISFYYLYEVAGWYDEGIALFGLAAACLDGKRESDAVRARLITRRASLARSVGRLDEAEAWFSDGLALARAVGDESNQAYALRQLGYFPMLRGDVPSALASMEEALRIYRILNDLPRIADSLMSIGICKLRLGQMAQAAALYQEAADIMTEVGDEVGCSMAYDNLGDAAYFSGEYEQAMRHYTAAAEIQRRYDEHRQLAVSQNNAAEVLCKLKCWDEALAAAQESVTLFREMNSRDGLMHAMNSEAHAWLGLGELGRASEVFGEVLLLGEQLHADTELLSMLVLGGRLLAARGQVDEAAQVLYAVQHNPASPAFTADEAKAELGALPAEVVAQAEAAPAWSLVAAVANARKCLVH
jgi:tetratricopeptide (TPR) repeat protein